MKAVRVLLAHDDAFFRSLLRGVLAEAGAVVVAEATGPDGAVALLRSERPDVVVTGPTLAAASAEPLVAEAAGAGTAALVLSDDRSAGPALRLLRAGAAGFLSRDLTVAGLVAAIGAVHRGESPLDAVVGATLVREWRSAAGGAGATGDGPTLSARELDVLRALADGRSTKGIAADLQVSVKTVEHHKTRLFSKLGVKNQAQAVSTALSRGLLTSPEASP